MGTQDGKSLKRSKLARRPTQEMVDAIRVTCSRRCVYAKPIMRPGLVVSLSQLYSKEG